MVATTQLGIDTQIMVFKTNIQDENDIRRAEFILNNHYSILRWTVDLQDWERVLRIEAAANFRHDEVERLLSSLGYKCSELMH
jgi:hypothetical protein